MTQKIWCCGCNAEVIPTLVNGSDIYPHRPDLFDLPFWLCDCGNYVGCHHKTNDRTKPLGNIPTPEIRAIRQKIHALVDPLWKSGKFSRGQIYSQIAKLLESKTFHIAEINSVEEAEKIISIIKEYNENSIE